MYLWTHDVEWTILPCRTVVQNKCLNHYRDLNRLQKALHWTELPPLVKINIHTYLSNFLSDIAKEWKSSTESMACDTKGSWTSIQMCGSGCDRQVHALPLTCTHTHHCASYKHALSACRMLVNSRTPGSEDVMPDQMPTFHQVHSVWEHSFSA